MEAGERVGPGCPRPSKPSAARQSPEIAKLSYLAAGMLEELDRAAKELNVSRQAVIKTLIRKPSIDNTWPASAAPPGEVRGL